MSIKKELLCKAVIEPKGEIDFGLSLGIQTLPIRLEDGTIEYVGCDDEYSEEFDGTNYHTT